MADGSVRTVGKSITTTGGVTGFSTVSIWTWACVGPTNPISAAPPPSRWQGSRPDDADGRSYFNSRRVACRLRRIAGPDLLPSVQQGCGFTFATWRITKRRNRRCKRAATTFPDRREAATARHRGSSPLSISCWLARLPHPADGNSYRAQLDFFEQKIRPVLVERLLYRTCHSARRRRRSRNKLAWPYDTHAGYFV